jgi:hypothetical protein
MSISKIGDTCRKRKNDVVYTPLSLAKKMIEMCDITPDMKVLDPSVGEGVFYDNLPECTKHWCEITKGRDFFDETEKYDLIIGNPPYSIWTKWLEHTIRITDKFCYIFGAMNMTPDRIMKIQNAGFGITQMLMVDVRHWFAYSFAVVFERQKPSIMTVLPTIKCECGKSCGRGAKGKSPNKCGLLTATSTQI